MIHKRTLQSLEFNQIVDQLASQCVSSTGRELALATAPLADRQTAEDAFRLYEDSAVWAASPAGSSFSLGSFPDIAPLLGSLAKKRTPTGLQKGFYLDREALWGLKQMLATARQAFSSILEEGMSSQWPHLRAHAQNHALPAQLLAALNRSISDDMLLKDESSPELFRIRQELRQIHQSCLRKARDFAQQYNMLAYLQDEFITLASDRYVLPLKANFKGRMRGIIHDWSQTGETCYFEPYFLIEINNRLQELKHEEREEERRILEYLTGLADAEMDEIAGSAALLARLDYLQAVRRLAESLDASCLTFSGSSEGIDLIEARHPLLQLAHVRQKDKPAARPLNISLRAGERALIITGGNAGGKTVCLKTLGLLAAMAMAGLPVPAGKGSHLPWFGRMDAFIGDEQSLAENVSTFSAQIDHLAKAFRHFGDSSLVLLDEFGAGTDPAEGAALAQGLHDELLEKRCFVLSATHFPALKSYALTKDGVRAASMLFDPATSKPLFRLAYDQVGSSHALEVASAHGLPESILARARHYLLQDGEDTATVLDRLNRLAARREEELASLAKQENRLQATLAEQREKLARERQKLQDEVNVKIRQLMGAWQKEKISARQAMKDLAALRPGLEASRKTEAPSILPASADFETGQEVMHTAFHKRGVITEVDKKRKRARVDLNGVGVWAQFEDLRLPGANQPKTGTVSHVKVPVRGPALTLDVRGMRAAEAVAEVERFLDKAILGGSQEIEIVHGKGTGALRKEIHSFLKGFPAIEHISLAPEDRGGDGMTIVALK